MYLIITEDMQIYQTEKSLEELSSGIIAGVIDVVRYKEGKFEVYWDVKDGWIDIQKSVKK